MITPFQIPCAGNLIQVHPYGQGPELLVVFHGFGETGAGYAALGSRLEARYTVVVPDLPYHGGSKWEKGTLTPARLAELLRALLQHTGRTRCALLGYSMGGRLALCAARELPEAISRLLLVAPEGLSPNPWLFLATRTLLGYGLFHQIIFHPKWVSPLIRLTERMGLVKKRQAAFVRELLAREDRRLQLFHCWRCFRWLTPVNAKRILQRSSPPARLLFGRQDRLVPPPGKRERDRWQPARVQVLPGDHQLLLQRETLNEIYGYLCAP